MLLYSVALSHASSRKVMKAANGRKTANLWVRGWGGGGVIMVLVGMVGMVGMGHPKERLKSVFTVRPTADLPHRRR